MNNNSAIPATINEQVENIQNLEISYRVLHPKAYLYDKSSDRTITFPFSSIINKYKDFLYNIITEIDLSEEEQAEYEGKPKLLSEYLYGTTELWDSLLILNNAVYTSEFKPKKLKLYDPAKFKTYLNEIMLIEEELGNISY